ncbi:Nucleolar protein 11-like [Papilio machaon]|uniref:Nucleolar protein 11-like n=1 Tax=Papilio machaon TaxID=76193 RepID=A0A0N1PJG8_PAPMA|nr:Nucleolar protein 11-like [Papilio machaon]
MAKLHNYYVLCPLIDQKSFLGITHDKEESSVIVSLGRNVVNKYRLSDQKQVGGWTSKDHITAAVIYDNEQDHYVGVFNNNAIKTWKEDSDNLDKIKKQKFPMNILKLIRRGDESPLVIFANGNCAALSFALDNRKSIESKALIKETDSIVDISYYKLNNTPHICYIIKNNKDNYEILTCPLREELGDMEKTKLQRIKVSRTEDVYVVGHLIAKEKLGVYILWSDGKLTVYDFEKKNWRTIGSVPWISTFSSVSIAWMGKNHLIFFGSNVEQDGAIIVAYNIVLGVGSCKYPMKMYTEGAKLYCFDNRIVLEASNHIGMLPYVVETKRNLSSLLGSHEVTKDESTEIANWGTPTRPLYHSSEDIKDLINLGLTERSICSQIIPLLLEKNDHNKIVKVLNDFKDVPESILVLLLSYAIKLVNPNNIDVTNNEEFLRICESDLQSEGTRAHNSKLNFLNYVLQIPVSDATLVPYLRNGLSLDNALFLMSYISYLLVDSEMEIHIEYESKLLDWCTLLMDAFYQQYLMTKDEKVTFVLETMKLIVDNLVDQLMVVDSLLPKLHQTVSGKQANNDVDDLLSYTIELMEI